MGITQLEDCRVPWHRPVDYYAEMVKSDDHMLKVKEQLMFEQRNIEETAQRYAPSSPCPILQNGTSPEAVDQLSCNSICARNVFRSNLMSSRAVTVHLCLIEEIARRFMATVT